MLSSFGPPNQIVLIFYLVGSYYFHIFSFLILCVVHSFDNVEEQTRVNRYAPLCMSDEGEEHNGRDHGRAIVKQSINNSKLVWIRILRGELQKEIELAANEKEKEQVATEISHGQ